MIDLSVICPTLNEEKYISSFLDSIINQNDIDVSKIELLVIDGMSSDKTRCIVNEYRDCHPFIEILDNPQRTVPHALNIGIAKSKGKYIIRLDAHAIFPPNYLSLLVKNSKLYDSDNIGGVIRTIPANDSIVAKSIALALTLPFGMGNSHFRVGSKKVRQVDTVPFGCFKREVFDKVGIFDTDLVRNQDDEFNGRIIKNGGRVFLIPEIVVDYYARDKASKVARMFYQYGLFKPLVNKKLGFPTTLRQFYPLLFVIGLIIGFGLSFISSFLFFIYVSVLIIYFGLSLYFSFFSALKFKNIGFIFSLPYIFLIIHISYGWGYLIGIFRFLILCKKKQSVNINR